MQDPITKGTKEEAESLCVELQRDETKEKVLLVVCYWPPNLMVGEGPPITIWTSSMDGNLLS